MSTENYTCFIISPIGNKLGNSEEQKKYDQFSKVLDYLITPALRFAGFRKDKIIRSDKETRAGRISDSIMTHLKQDELCIAVLTDLNPNVMYEYGVRVGIGKPVIPIASADIKLPFDVIDTRTLMYNIETIDGLMDAQKKLTASVKEEVEKGFSPQQGSGSFTDLSDRLQKIERSLAQLIAASGSTTAAAPGGAAAEVINKLGDIQAAFNYALRNRDVVLGEELMPRLQAQLDKESYFDLVVSQLAAMGSRKAFEELKSNWKYIVDNLTLRQQYEELGSYISACNRYDKEVQELDFVAAELESLEQRIINSDLQDDEKSDLRGGIYNQRNRLYYGAYQTANKSSRKQVHKAWLIEAIESLEKAIQVNDKEASYYYNLAICYRENKQLEEAERAIDRSIELDGDDSDHLRLAYKIYIDVNNGEKAKAVKESLEKLNPYAAAML